MPALQALFHLSHSTSPTKDFSFVIMAHLLAWERDEKFVKGFFSDRVW
jgi:hypothetical protein